MRLRCRRRLWMEYGYGSLRGLRWRGCPPILQKRTHGSIKIPEFIFMRAFLTHPSMIWHTIARTWPFCLAIRWIQSWQGDFWTFWLLFFLAVARSLMWEKEKNVDVCFQPFFFQYWFFFTGFLSFFQRASFSTLVGAVSQYFHISLFFNRLFHVSINSAVFIYT